MRDGSSRAGFGADFVFGAATSAFQIEGATDQGGRGESIWDRFCSRPGAIADGSDGRRACEHYARYREDIGLLRELGVDAYRFSVAWPRVVPQGRGAANAAGLDFYSRLVDGLLDAGIEPVVTLYHWDLPQALEELGGWPERATASAFADYTQYLCRHLGDRVRRWITINEPWCSAYLGYELGVHAPGRASAVDALAASHHLLLAHGLSLQVLRAERSDFEVGIALNLTPVHPASNGPEDVAAARLRDGLLNRLYLDPLYGRDYPKDVLEHHMTLGHLREPSLPWVQDGDLECIAGRTDFLGVNYYSRELVRAGDVSITDLTTSSEGEARGRTDIGWEVYPEGLREILRRVHQDYAPTSLLVTENGAAYGIGPDEDQEIRDVQRIRYVREHLDALLLAKEDGTPVDGYFAWSLLDNFEWAWGYGQRFGLIWVDFDTQERRCKHSARFYADVIARRALPSP